MTPKRIARFRRLCRGLDRLMAEILDTCPGAEYYVSDGAIHLMSGPSHDGSRAVPHPERVVAHVYVRRIDGGGW